MKYRDYNDYELIDYVSENNDDAREIVYEKYKPIIIKNAQSFIKTNGNQGIDINDLIQEGMIALNYAVNNFDSKKDTTFYTYAMKCVKGRMISAINASLRLKQKLLNESISIEQIGIEKLGDNNNNPENIVMNVEDKIELIDKINKILTKTEQEVFKLKMEGFNYKEIAEILNKTPKSIDNAIQRIRNKTKNLLNDK